nr:retrovirus-related Pol polyprotein from transposon TNT 1-94 [Tanacetum cinerariifolium]
LKSSKDLESLIESQRPEKIKDELGYNAVPPPAADLYLSPKKDLSWTGLPEFADNTVTDYSRPAPPIESTSEDGQNRISSASENGEPSDSILSKPAKNTVKYAEMYRTPSKKPTVRGNQRNWNNLTTQQLGPDFAMKKKACYNCGDFSHLANDCRKRVQRETTRNFPPVNKKLPTGNSNVSTVCCCCSRHVNTARLKAVINRRNRVKDVQASACWVWKPIKPNSASIILKRYDYVDVRGRSRPDDCRNYPECEICGSYDHSTLGHNRVIHIKGGVLAESSQSNESTIGVKCNTYENTVHSTSDHNKFDHFKRGEKIQAAKAMEPTKN